MKPRYAGGNWYKGAVQGCAYQAKVYDEPSRFGIGPDGEPGNSRVSKLWIKEPSGPVILNYDRGSDIITPKGLELARLILEYFA